MASEPVGPLRSEPVRLLRTAPGLARILWRRVRAVGLTAPLSSPTPTPASQPTTPGGPGSSPQPGTGPDIYSWLPFSQAGLAAAADLVHRFAAA